MNPTKSAIRWLAILAFANAGPVVGAETVLLKEAGMLREYEIATDEICARDAVTGIPRIRKVPEGTSETGAGVARLVIYRKGQLRDDLSRRVVANRVKAKLAPGHRTMDEAQALADSLGLSVVREKISRNGWVTFGTAGSRASLTAASMLGEHAWTIEANPVLGARFYRRACDLNLQGVNLNDPLFTAQWYFRNGEPFNLNIQPVWLNRAPANSPLAAITGRPGPFLARPYNGEGVVIGIADDAVEWEHEDLRGNFVRTHNHDFVDDDGDPSPNDNSEPHGTWITGVAGAIGGNGKGVVGAAPAVGLAALRFFAATQENLDVLIDVFDHRRTQIDILNNSWGTAPYFPIPQDVLDELEDQVADRDRIFVFSVGDNRAANELSGYQRLHDSRFSITVGALNSIGAPSSESTGGSSVLVVGLTGDDNLRSIVTTELNDQYVTTGVGGTSFAAPQISGIVALMLQARPELGWRDVQAILRNPYLSEDGIEPPPHDYLSGFGLVDAALAVRKAEVTPLLPVDSHYQCARLSRTVNRTLDVTQTDLNPAADHGEWEEVFFDFTTRSNPNLLVEHVELTVEWEAGSTELPVDIEITSPARFYDDEFANGDAFEGRFVGAEGSSSILSYAPFDDDDAVYPAPELWTYTSVRHWGENSTRGVLRGVWRVRVRLRHFSDTLPLSRRLRRLEMKLWGTDNNAPPTVANANTTGSSAPATLDPRTVNEDDDILISNIVLRDTDYEPNDFAYQWQTLDETSGIWSDVPGQGGNVTGLCNYTGPKAEFDVSRYPALSNIAISYHDLSSGGCGSIVGWDWDFGDGTTSTLQNPSHSFAAPGLHMVTLTATDDQGNTNSVRKPIRTLAVGEDVPTDLLDLPFNDDAPGRNAWSGVLTLPAALTVAGNRYRCRIVPRDLRRVGQRFFTSPVSVNAPPPGVVSYGDPFQFHANIPVITAPPDSVAPFVLVNEFSQGAIPDTNAEWVELLTTVEIDLRNYKVSDSIVTFNVEFSQHELWKAVPAGTLIVVYNAAIRDPQLPPDDFDMNDGIVVMAAQNSDFFLLPPNGDGWGAFPNFDPAHVSVLDRFCVPLHGVSWNESETFEPSLNEEDNGAIAFRISQQEAAHADSASLLGYFEAANWKVTAAFAVPANTNAGVSPGGPNSGNNQAAMNAAIASARTSIPRYAYAPAITGLSIDPDSGMLSGTPDVPDGAVIEVTITRSHSWDSGTQVFTLTLLPSPDDEDGDRDGVVALAERAMGMDNRNSDAEKLPTASIVHQLGNDYLGITFRRLGGGIVEPATGAYRIATAFGDIRYELWTSNDLETWQNASSSGSFLDVAVIAAPDNPAVEIVTMRMDNPIAQSDAQQYVQLRLTRLPL